MHTLLTQEFRLPSQPSTTYRQQPGMEKVFCPTLKLRASLAPASRYKTQKVKSCKSCESLTFCSWQLNCRMAMASRWRYFLCLWEQETGILSQYTTTLTQRHPWACGTVRPGITFQKAPQVRTKRSNAQMQNNRHSTFLCFLYACKAWKLAQEGGKPWNLSIWSKVALCASYVSNCCGRGGRSSLAGIKPASSRLSESTLMAGARNPEVKLLNFQVPQVDLHPRYTIATPGGSNHRAASEQRPHGIHGIHHRTLGFVVCHTLDTIDQKWWHKSHFVCLYTQSRSTRSLMNATQQVKCCCWIDWARAQHHEVVLKLSSHHLKMDRHQEILYLITDAGRRPWIAKSPKSQIQAKILDFGLWDADSGAARRTTTTQFDGGWMPRGLFSRNSRESPTGAC